MNTIPRFTALLAFLLLVFSSLQAYSQDHRQIHVISTGDVHGSFFSQPFVDGGNVKTSLMSAKVVIDSIRQVAGAENVLLLDAGDILQGSNATYYYNFVADAVPHIYPRLAKYMGYDAVVLGNHDIETGHPVYDRVFDELMGLNIPWLAGNVLSTKDGSTYFPLYRIFKKAGVKVAVFGFENANIKAWLGKELYEGMDFFSLVPFAQSMIDYVVKKEKPQVVIVVAHTGTGKGDLSQLENQGLDLFNSLKGVDLLVGAHDHRPYVSFKSGFAYLNAGNNVQNVGHAVIDLTLSGKKVVSKDVTAELCKVDKDKIDWGMQVAFSEDFEAVKTFTNHQIGILDMTLDASESTAGMCNYLNFLHTVSLKESGADISFAAPLSDRFKIEPRKVIFDDMLTIYRFENKLSVVQMKGSEIKNYLEYSYEHWLKKDVPSYNFDSAGGIVYTVDASKPFGERVEIKSMANGSAFKMDAMYKVAMTSYRANGGGDLMPKGAGLDSRTVEFRTVATYPSIRDMVRTFFESTEKVDQESVSDSSVIGFWEFLNR